jgi:hypothetical protein
MRSSRIDHPLNEDMAAVEAKAPDMVANVAMVIVPQIDRTLTVAAAVVVTEATATLLPLTLQVE